MGSGELNSDFFSPQRKHLAHGPSPQPTSNTFVYLLHFVMYRVIHEETRGKCVGTGAFLATCGSPGSNLSGLLIRDFNHMWQNLKDYNSPFRDTKNKLVIQLHPIACLKLGGFLSLLWGTILLKWLGSNSHSLLWKLSWSSVSYITWGEIFIHCRRITQESCKLCFNTVSRFLRSKNLNSIMRLVFKAIWHGQMEAFKMTIPRTEQERCFSD